MSQDAYSLHIIVQVYADFGKNKATKLQVFGVQSGKDQKVSLPLVMGFKSVTNFVCHPLSWKACNEENETEKKAKYEERLRECTKTLQLE